MSVRLGKLNIKNPLLVASGTFGLGNLLPEKYKHAGAFISKTITPKPRAGNPPPRIVETPSGIVNYVGLENPGVDAFLEMTKGISFPTVFIASLYAESPAELNALIGKMETERRIAGYELNLSCPNIRQRRVMPSLDSVFIRKMMRAARRSTKKWICAKLPPYSCIDVSPVCEDAGADALTLCNTYPAVAYSPSGVRIQGGLAGPAIKPMTLYNVFQTATRVRIPIIASGGICSGKDVVEFMDAGAAAVQVGSIQYVDPDAVRRILAEWQGLKKRR